MSTQSPDEIGTLIVVVLRGKNLPNKRHIGKQDPYCTLEVGKQKLRTKVVKRGGQHPDWDEEVRFPILDDAVDTSATGDQPPPVPAKSPRADWNRDRTMLLSVYADDPRDPELIGEIKINLKEVLTKGETDEWYPLTFKGKYSGEIYLEMTFWSNHKPPARSQPSREGIFEAVTPDRQRIASNSTLKPSPVTEPSRTRRSSFSTPDRAGDIMPDAGLRASPPEILRPSSSLANLDLYVAPWEDRNRLSTPRPQYDDFGAAQSDRRRESFHSEPSRERGRSESRAHPTPPLMHGHSRYSESSLTSSMSSLSVQGTPDSHLSHGRHSRHSTGSNLHVSQAYHDPFHERSQHETPHHSGYSVPYPPSTPFQNTQNGTLGFVPPRNTPSPFVQGVQDSYPIPYPPSTPVPSSSLGPRRASFNDLTAYSHPLHHQQMYSTPSHPSSRSSVSPSPSPSSVHFSPYQQPLNNDQFAPPLSLHPTHIPQERELEPAAPMQQRFIPPPNQTFGAQSRYDSTVRHDLSTVVASPPPISTPAPPNVPYQSLPVNTPLGPVATGGRPLPTPQQIQQPHSQSPQTPSYTHAVSSGLNIPPPPPLSALTPPPPPPPSLFQHLQPSQNGNMSPIRNQYANQDDGSYGSQSGGQSYRPRVPSLPPAPTGSPFRPQSAFEALGGTLPGWNIPPPPPLPSANVPSPNPATQSYGSHAIQAPVYPQQSYPPPPPPPQLFNSEQQRW